MSAEISRPSDETGQPLTQHPTSLPSAPVKIVHLGEEPGPRCIPLQIVPSLLRYDADLGLYVTSMTPAEARHTARILLSLAAEVDADKERIATEAAGTLKDGGPRGAGVAALNDEQIIVLIQQYPQVFQVWLNGYEAGLIGGRADQRLEDHQIAVLAARIAVAQVENQADIRTTVRHAAQYIHVHLAREKNRLANLNRPDSRRFTWESADPEAGR